MRDLFDAPVLPGLSTAPEMVSGEEERALMAAIDGAGLSPFRFQNWTGLRQTLSFGFSYDFVGQHPIDAAPIPDWLLPLRARMAAFAGLPPGDLIQALLIRYDPRAGIGWHRDRPIYGHVLGLSLGDRAVMRFRRRRGDAGFERAALPLDPRAAYHLTGAARHLWEHSIAAVSSTRWSITFRSLAPPS